MFVITGGKGFQMTFENGWTISVQWGPGNYCSNRDTDFGIPAQIAARHGEYQSFTAEVTAWTSKPEDDDPIKAFVRAEDVAEAIAEVAAR